MTQDILDQWAKKTVLEMEQKKKVAIHTKNKIGSLPITIYKNQL